jgi:phospholipase A1
VGEENTQETRESDTVKDGEKRDAKTFSRYNPNYFAYGTPTTKIQFSFKFRLVRNLSFYSGYTQTMFWELTKESAPFQDVNFNPEFFYAWQTKHQLLESVDLIPVWHKSNGTDGIKSRSANGFGVRFNGRKELITNLFQWSLGLHHYFSFEPENRDIRDYWGPWEVSVSWLQFYKSVVDRTELTLKFWGGGTYG